jgi:diguanylate cyclase (GGDEF)-like protein
VTIADLQATLPPLPPDTGEHSTVQPASERHDTPHAFVLPRDPHADRATLTMLSGPGTGATFRVESRHTTLGRSPRSSIPMDVDSVSRMHARITREGDGHYVLEDLDSTNGTFLNGRRVHRESLRSGDRVQLGGEGVFRFAIVDEMEDTMQRRLYETASRDELTGLLNRRTLFDRLSIELAHAVESGSDLGLLMIDVDHFKRVNDTFGHVAGDQVLRAVALTGSQGLRAGDILARYGGEEFVLVAPGVDGRAATTLAERVRKAIGGVRVEVGGGAIGLTVSIGVARLSECSTWTNAQDLVSLADGRLYEAKRQGRNRVADGT